MPGGRLTQQERRQIALGPADSLAYAEIARRLDRPTSTITREVMRNGGPTAYRADLAHRATEHRAHRRRPASSRGPESVPQPHGRDDEAVAEYEETLHHRPHGFGPDEDGGPGTDLLFPTDAGSLTASQLAQRLRVSPASISKAIAFLESQSLVRRERDERRRDRYVVDDELFYQATIAGARSNDQLVETARQGVAVLGPHTPAATRLENIARFLDFISESITRAAEQAREVLHTKSETTLDDTARPSPEHGWTAVSIVTAMRRSPAASSGRHGTASRLSDRRCSGSCPPGPMDAERRFSFR